MVLPDDEVLPSPTPTTTLTPAPVSTPQPVSEPAGSLQTVGLLPLARRVGTDEERYAIKVPLTTWCIHDRPGFVVVVGSQNISLSEISPVVSNQAHIVRGRKQS